MHGLTPPTDKAVILGKPSEFVAPHSMVPFLGWVWQQQFRKWEYGYYDPHYHRNHDLIFAAPASSRIAKRNLPRVVANAAPVPTPAADQKLSEVLHAAMKAIVIARTEAAASRSPRKAITSQRLEQITNPVMIIAKEKGFL